MNLYIERKINSIFEGLTRNADGDSLQLSKMLGFGHIMTFSLLRTQD
jgi:hypothetical protein